jgi:peptidoglycan/LPS O-acetylase OafA/YrhL
MRTEPANHRAPDPVSSHRSPVRARPGPARPATPAPGRIRQIDIVKGLAIIGVMVQHAFSARFLRQSWDTLWAGQAVPVFFVLMGLNAARSTARSPVVSLRGLYTWRYARGRLDRLVLPLLVTWVLALVVAVAVGRFHIGPLVVLGVLPIASAPGNYFITVVLEFALLFPAVYVCFARAPVRTTLVIVAADVAFEVLAPHVGPFKTTGIGHGYLYEAAIVKYATAILAGMWLSRITITPERARVLFVAATACVVYLVVLHQRPSLFHWLTDSFSRSTNFLSVFYAVWLTWLALLRLTPRRWFGALEQLGRASYHVFLIQIIWFGAVSGRAWPVAILGMLACCGLGWVFYRAFERPRGSRPGKSPQPAAAAA